MTNSRFHLQQQVDRLYGEAPRQLAFRATTPAEFHAWREALRQQVRILLGIAGRTFPPVCAEKIQAITRNGYVEEKWMLDVGDTEAPVYILVPNTDPPYKPIMAFHGHDPNAQYILGNHPDADTEREMLAVDNNYAQALAQKGYLVCVIEQRGFGERISNQVKDPGYPVSCRHLSFEYLMQGRTMIGERVWDGICALNFVQTRSDIIPGHIGCTGNSGGGKTTLWLSALDERISVTVPSCYFCSFKHSILSVYHCECNYVPDVLQYAEMGDLAALIAPRPLRIIAGEQDPIFPIAGVREQYETVQRAYDLLGVPEHCSLAIHSGGHAYNHTLSQEWFHHWL